MSSWSEYQFQVANRFISQQVRRYGRHMDEIECMQEGWRAFLYARRTYRKVAGCCNFAVYAEYAVREALDLMRYRRNQRIRLESPCSLDMSYEDGNETVGARLARKVGDCANSIALWDYAQRQGSVKYRILKQLFYQFEDWEIIEENNLTPDTYYMLLEEIQEAFVERKAM